MADGAIAVKVGDVYGKLTVIERYGSTPRQMSRWLCRCECGTERVFASGNLRSGNSTSCGCGKPGRGRTRHDAER